MDYVNTELLFVASHPDSITELSQAAASASASTTDNTAIEDDLHTIAHANIPEDEEIEDLSKEERAKLEKGMEREVRDWMRLKGTEGVVDGEETELIKGSWE